MKGNILYILHYPHWGYEDNGEHFYAESFSGMESCVVNNLISEEKLYDELDRSFTICLRNNPTIDVFFDVILNTIYLIHKNDEDSFKKEWVYSDHLIESIICYWKKKQQEEKDLEKIQEIQRFLNWFNENQMNGKLGEICQ